jgi:FtsP/CotA-like multicopper oxidase with cupredoxin domain
MKSNFFHKNKKNWVFSIFTTSFFLFVEMKGEPIELYIAEKKIHVNGKEAIVLSLLQPDGTFGARMYKGNLFDVILKNTMEVPTSIHWHGLILPNNQDGVAFITQYPLYPGLQYHYKFQLEQSGTYWMHSHVGLQEQRLLSAPLIIYNPEDSKIASQEVILFLADFSFKSPSEIYGELRSGNKEMKNGMSEMNSQDIVEVDYDAFLTNYRVLENPDIIKVEPGKKVRIRVINGASATNFFINLGTFEGEAIAVDGNRIKPLISSQFELAVAQRIDILITIPKEGGSFPILAQGEGTDKQTGIILTTNENSLPKLSSITSNKASPLKNIQERNLQALFPLAKKAVDKLVHVELGGNMAKYIWTINNQTWPEATPIVVEKDQRVEIIIENNSSMSHPMHLHGHVFQVTAFNGKEIEGAIRDTVLVMPNSTISIQFDANNPGVWPFHCHVLYHMEAGMFTVVRYKDFVQPL